MKTSLVVRIWRYGFVAIMLAAPMLVACAKPDVPVPIHGVNYRAEVFSYVLVDPTNANNTGGGELIDPFSAGGTMCCYTLPAKWRPGLKVEIRETHWLPKLADDTLPEVSKKHLVEIPQYAAGRAGELWVIRAPDGSMNVVSSNFQPDHKKWPGEIKGWPVPSIQYLRERQDVYIMDAKKIVDIFSLALKELNESPLELAKSEWTLATKYEPKELKSYAGPGDPAYLTMLKKSYEDALVSAREKLQREEAARP